MKLEGFDKIILELRKIFPFEDYISKEYEVEMRKIFSSLKNFIEKDKNYKLLDIGCGPMDKTAFFQLIGFECYAVDDLSDPWHLINDNTEKIISFSKKLGIKFHKQSLDDYSIPFNTKFDIITSFAVIEHLHESPKYLLNTIGELMVDDGILVITVPNSVALHQRIKVLFGYSNLPRIDLFYNSIGKWRGHIREYTLKELEYIIEKNNFKVIYSKNFDIISYKKFKEPISSIYNLITKIIPNSGYVNFVIAKKPKNWTPVVDDLKDYFASLKSAVPKGVLDTLNKSNDTK